VSERTIDLSILMPVYDERATVEQAIEAVLERELGASYELIVVDDGSRDGTRELLANGAWQEHVRLLAHDRNLGKGAAIRTGLAAAPHSAYSFWYVVGNRSVTLFANVIYNCSISDLMTGHRALHTDLRCRLSS
jgi:dolichol-phosphate hexosyltransferase